MSCRGLCLLLVLQGLVFVLLTPVSVNPPGKAQPALEAKGAKPMVSAASWLQHRGEKPALQGWEPLQPPEGPEVRCAFTWPRLGVAVEGGVVCHPR